MTAVCALVLTAVTALVMPSELILFGVLHFNACAVLLSCLLRPVLEKIPPAAGLAGSAVLFALFNQLPWGFLGFEGLHLARVPDSLYKANLFWLGLPDLNRFSSADYFPLLPWLFLFWCGYFGWKCLVRYHAAPAASRCAPWAAGRCWSTCSTSRSFTACCLG